MPQQSTYNNRRALSALIKASLRSTTKSPSAIVFTIAFPLIFIMVFGFLGGDKMFSIGVAAAPGSDTTSEIYTVLHNNPVLKWATVADSNELNKNWPMVI